MRDRRGTAVQDKETKWIPGLPFIYVQKHQQRRVEVFSRPASVSVKGLYPHTRRSTPLTQYHPSGRIELTPLKHNTTKFIQCLTTTRLKIQIHSLILHKALLQIVIENPHRHALRQTRHIFGNGLLFLVVDLKGSERLAARTIFPEEVGGDGAVLSDLADISGGRK